MAVSVEGLLEREDALTAIRDALTDARSGRGSALGIPGPAGIGKSSMLSAVRSLAEQSGFTVLAACGGELEHEFPFGVMRQAFEAGLRAMSLRDRRTLMEGGAEVVGGLLGVGGSSRARAIDGAAASSGLFWLAANFAERNPVLLAVDDAQWADTGSLAALVYLARRVSDLALLLIVTWRSDTSGTAPELEHLRGLSHELRLHVLSAPGCAELARRTLPAATESFCDACQRLTGGNPFLIEELVREARSRGLAPDGQGALALAELGPPRVERSVSLRLADLPTQAVALARALSILGDGAELRHAAALTGLTMEESLVGFDELRAAGLLAAGQPVRFVHTLVRQAIYSLLPEGERLSAHRRAAGLYAADGRPTDQTASHLLIAPPAGDDWVVDRLAEAGRDAMRAGSPSAAVGFLARSLAEPPPLKRRPQLVFALAEAEARAGNVAAVGHLREAVATLERPPERGKAALMLARELEARGDDAGAHDALALALSNATGDRDLELVVCAELLLLEATSREVMADGIAQRIWRTARSVHGETLAERAVLGAYGYALGLTGRGTSLEAAEAARRALQDGTMLDRLGLVSLLMEPMMILMVTDPSDQLPERILERGYELASRNGSPFETVIAYTIGCYLWWLRGRLARAEADGETAVRIAREQDLTTNVGMTVGYQLRVLTDRGKMDAADQLLDETLSRWEATGSNRAAHATLLGGAAHLHIARGRWEQALAASQQVGELMAGRGSCTPIAAWRAWATTALVGLGRIDEASRLAIEHFEIASRWASTRAIGQAHHALALTQTGEARISTLQSGVEILRSAPVPVELARVLLELGASRRRMGERRAARESLREALELATRCQADLLADRATTELSAAGARPRRPMRSGIDALTPSELRIATMAADGLSNPQIAQSLFVTRKTVEAHLAHAYQKLSVNSRSQLCEALRPTST